MTSYEWGSQMRVRRMERLLLRASGSSVAEIAWLHGITKAHVYADANADRRAAQTLYRLLLAVRSVA